MNMAALSIGLTQISLLNLFSCPVSCNRSLLCYQDWPRIHYAAQAALTLIVFPTSASELLELLLNDSVSGLLALTLSVLLVAALSSPLHLGCYICAVACMNLFNMVAVHATWNNMGSWTQSLGCLWLAIVWHTQQPIKPWRIWLNWTQMDERNMLERAHHHSPSWKCKLKLLGNFLQPNQNGYQESKRQKNLRVDKGEEEPLFTASGYINWENQCGNPHEVFSKQMKENNLKYRTILWSTYAASAIYRELSRPTTEILFYSRKWNILSCPWTHEWIMEWGIDTQLDFIHPERKMKLWND